MNCTFEYRINLQLIHMTDMQADRRIKCFLCTRAVCNLILFVLLTLAYTLPVFATMTISQECLAINPFDGSEVNKLYCNLFLGLGNTYTCTTSQNMADFCLQWSNHEFWSKVDNLAGSTMQTEAQYEWPLSFIAVPLSSAFCILAFCALVKVNDESVALISFLNYIYYTLLTLCLL